MAKPLRDPIRALGLMSGTSLDGIDVAMITTDGEEVVERGPSQTTPYPSEFRNKLRQTLADAVGMTARDQRPGCLAEVERELTERHAEAVKVFLAKNAIKSSTIDVAGFHGQTVLHRPRDRLTVQLGDGPGLAKLLGIDVVYDLRAADIAAGGQGAPLVPVYHRALAEFDEAPIAFLNIGGVANVTWVGSDGSLIAFDTGPGNAQIDDFVAARTGQAFDRDGALSASGKADTKTVARFLQQAYFKLPPPKSLDRGAMAIDIPSSMSTADGAATLAVCAALAVDKARDWFPERSKSWIVCGGGRHNVGVMQSLSAALMIKPQTAEAVGLNGDSMEAEAWAYLAVRSLRGLPISFPMTTGVPTPMTGGVLARGRV